MKTTNILMIAAAMLAFAPAAKAGQVDFDGACGAKPAGLGASLSSMAAPAAPAPEPPAACGEAAGPVLSVAVEKNATAKATFDAEGRQADAGSVQYLINIKSAGTDSHWAVGSDDKIYALGAARQAPEFAAVRRLANALALTGNPGAARGKRCETDTSYICLGGQTNECKVDRCGWCGNHEDGYYCDWETTSAPYGCRPNGYRCN